MPHLTTSHLLQAIQNAQAGQFRKSLAAIRSAKALEPENVHILALEKQLVKLSEFTDIGALSREEREENFEVLRILADRAKQNLRDHLYSLDQLIMGPDFSRHPVLSGGQRQATRTVLIKQYLLRADRCLASGDRDGALLEIHRIYVIDPGNPEAHEQEARIAAWHEPAAGDAAPAASHQQPSIPEGTRRDDRPEAAESSLTPVNPEIVLLATEGESSPRRDNHLFAFFLRRPLKKALRVISAVVGVASLVSFLIWKNQDDQTLMQKSLERLNSVPSEKRDTAQKHVAQTTPVPGMGAQARGEQEPAKTDEAREQKSEPPTLETQQLKTSGDYEATPIPKIPESSGRLKNGAVTEGAPELRGLRPTPLSLVARRPETAQPQQKVPLARSEPRLTRLATFNFPEELHRTGIEAEVVVQVQISAEGTPIQAEIIASTNPALDQAVVDGMMRSEFSPGKLQGGPVTAWVTIPLRFKK